MKNSTTTMMLLLTVLLANSGVIRASDLVTQEFSLSPGWNAIYLEVQPEASDPQTVFSGIPVESVWAWSDRESSVQFLLDPSELEWNQAGWLGYRSDPDEAVLTDLFALIANRAYLVKVQGSNAVNLSVTGWPSTRPTRWTPQAFNFTGFHLDPARSISLGDLLADSPAHAGEVVYAINKATQQWEIVNDPFSRQAKPGEAYWIYTASASSYQGPWNVDIVTAEGVDFGVALNTRVLRFQNVSAQTQTLAINELPTTNAVGLLYQQFNSTTVVYEWNPLAGLGSIQVPSGKVVSLTLGVERQTFGSPSVSSVLEVNNGNGSRLLIPVRARQ